MIETWKDAGIPLEAVLRGIGSAFDKYDQRPSKTRKVNSLAYCSQEVLAAAEEMKEATADSQKDKPSETAGFAVADIIAFLRRNAARLQSAELPESGVIPIRMVAQECATALNALAHEIEQATASYRLEDLEGRLTVLEEKLLAVLLAATSDDELLGVRAQADRDLAPYRSKVPAAQIAQLHKQYLQKRLLEKYTLPRLSLFYM